MTHVVNFTTLVDTTYELSISFNVVVDDGNLPSAITTSIVDLLTQIDDARKANPKLIYAPLLKTS